MDSKCQCPLYRRECQPLDWHRPENAFRLLEALVQHYRGFYAIECREVLKDGRVEFSVEKCVSSVNNGCDSLAEAICLAYVRANNIVIPDQPARGE